MIMTMEATAAFTAAIEAMGMTPPPEIIPDGRLHRFATNGRHDDTAGWYVLHVDGVPAGAFGCWRSGVNESWCGRAEHPLTAVEREAHRARIEIVRRQREIEEQQQHAAAAQRAQQLWDGARPAPETHPYLQRKQVQAHGLRIQCSDLIIAGQNLNGALIVPLHEAGDVLCSLEFIAADGMKLFLPGGRKRGCAYLIGTVGNVLCIVEGFATGASVHQATGYAVAVAFDAGNLNDVAKSFRKRYPNARLMVCGDNDQNGTGQVKAMEATESVGGLLVLPKGTGMDWNDVHQQNGLEMVQRGVAAVLDTSSVLDAVHAFLGRFVAYPSEHARIAHCLWIGHTHLMEAWESTPRLAFLSPEPGSGKTRALEISETLVPRPVEAINVSPAYLFRKISDSAGLPTILYDEIDTVFGPRAKEHEDLRGIINAGHRKGAMAGRCVVKGKQIETEELPAFCPIAMAGLGNLPDTILTRSVIIRMRRRAPGEHVEPYRRRLHAPMGHALRDQLAAWAAQIRKELNTCPSMPEGITDRNADVWEALLAIADAAGGPWPERARIAAVALVADAKGDRHSLGVRLLADLRTIFADRAALSTSDLLLGLTSLDEAPWGDLKGRPVDSRKLANLLRPYGVSSKNVRIGSEVVKGYCAEDLHDPWQRYLTQEQAVCLSPLGDATSATSEAAESIQLFQED